MLVTASGRRSVRLRPLEVPDWVLGAVALAALGLLLLAGSGPLWPALATFGLGAACVLTGLWIRGAAARRRAHAAHAAVVARTAAQLSSMVEHPLAAALDVLVNGPSGAPRSVAAVAREAAAAARTDDVEVLVAVGEDAEVAGLDEALHLLVAGAASAGAGGRVTVAVDSGRVEIRPGGSDPLATALARRAGGDVHNLGSLTVLQLPRVSRNVQ